MLSIIQSKAWLSTLAPQVFFLYKEGSLSFCVDRRSLRVVFLRNSDRPGSEAQNFSYRIKIQRT